MEKGVDGCWQCEDFSCDEGFFADEAWKGLCIGFVQCIKDKGIKEFVGLVESRLGKVVEYGDFRFKNEREIQTMLRGVEN